MKNRRKLVGSFHMAALIVLLAGALPLPASVIGTNTPAPSLTRARIEQLAPAAARPAWLAYLSRSEKQRQADKDFLQDEMRRAGVTVATTPPEGGGRSMPLNQSPEWYASPQARHTADVILSFQTPAGGWSKNMSMSGALRAPGERFAPNNLSRFLSPGDFDTPRDPDWNYVGTIDNNATTTELNFLARVITATGVKDSADYIRGFLRGVNYLLAAQFPNGGWPQVWPLEGSYHDAITYNDDAMTLVMEVMHSVAEGKGDFAFVPQGTRKQAAASFANGLRCVLATQIRVNGRLTVWAQQHDALTLKPVSGRNYEMPAQTASESANILIFLMSDLAHPTPAEARSIRAGVAWLKKVAIHGEQYRRMPNGRGRELVAAPGAPAIWARYYQIGTDKPIFGDRDKTIHDNVSDLSRERQNGYSWYNTTPQSALDLYAQWSSHRESK